MLVCLLQTRFEAQTSQMEAEFRLSLEQQINERLTTIQEENATHNTQLRQQHRYTHMLLYTQLTHTKQCCITDVNVLFL